MLQVTVVVASFSFGHFELFLRQSPRSPQSLFLWCGDGRCWLSAQSRLPGQNSLSSFIFWFL